jgi:hypothetical protein
MISFFLLTPKLEGISPLDIDYLLFILVLGISLV